MHQELEGLKDGKLADVAPTLIDLMGLIQPSEMTGQTLLQTYSSKNIHGGINPVSANS